VATPGRLVDHINNTESLQLNRVTFLVIDEADRSVWQMTVGLYLDFLTELFAFCSSCRQCFDTFGEASGRASGL